MWYNQRMSFKERIKNFDWKQNFLHLLEIASDASEVLIHLRDDPRPSDYVSISLKVANSWFHHSEKFKGHPFKGWHLVEIWEYKDFLYDISKRNYPNKIVRDSNDIKSLIVEIDGIKFGWEDFGSGEGINGPFVQSDIDREVYMKALGAMVWKSIGSTSCELGKKKGIVEDVWDGGVSVFRIDRQEDVHKSQVAEGILERSKKFLEKGYNRSIMLYGDPGTGKSSAMRYIAKEFGKNSLRINVGDLDHLNPEDILLAIELLNPSTLMIDDFDRTQNSTKLLSALEGFNNTLQLLMVSVNDVQALEPAVTRPGRFDDIIEVKTLDEGIINNLIGEGLPEKIKDRLKRLPIAFIVDFHKRREVLGLEESLKEVVELEKRIKKIDSSINGDMNPIPIEKKKKKKKFKLILNESGENIREVFDGE
jgi:hypothetical protein